MDAGFSVLLRAGNTGFSCPVPEPDPGRVGAWFIRAKSFANQSLVKLLQSQVENPATDGFMTLTECCIPAIFRLSNVIYEEEFV
jgi:hypothetical protein